MAFRTLLLLLGAATSACLQGTTDAPLAPLVTERLPNIPFSSIEPAEFSAEIVITSGDGTSVRGYARKGDKWKLVIFSDGSPASEMISGETALLVDHQQKTFAEAAESGPGFDPDPVQEMTIRVLREKQYTRYEELGSEGTIKRFRTSVSGSSTDTSVIHYDTSLGMIVKQEFVKGGVTADGPPQTLASFEMRNITMSVPDEAFQVPAGYKKVSEASFYGSQK